MAACRRVPVFLLQQNATSDRADINTYKLHHCVSLEPRVERNLKMSIVRPFWCAPYFKRQIKIKPRCNLQVWRAYYNPGQNVCLSKIANWLTLTCCHGYRRKSFLRSVIIFLEGFLTRTFNNISQDREGLVLKLSLFTPFSKCGETFSPPMQI